MDNNKIQDFCDVLKTFPDYEKDILKDLQRLCNNYEEKKEENDLKIKRIEKEKEYGRWDKIIKLQLIYLENHPNKQRVYNKYIGISKNLAESMVLDYIEHINAFNLYFETGIDNELFYITDY